MVIIESNKVVEKISAVTILHKIMESLNDKMVKIFDTAEKDDRLICDNSKENGTV